MIKVEDERARRFLSNRMAEIEQGAVVMRDKETEELKGEFEGMTLKTTRVALKKKNEDEQGAVRDFRHHSGAGVEKQRAAASERVELLCLSAAATIGADLRCSK